MSTNEINEDFYRSLNNPGGLSSTPTGKFAKEGIVVPTAPYHLPPSSGQSCSGGSGAFGVILWIVWIAGMSLLFIL